VSIHRRVTKSHGVVYDVRLRTPNGRNYKRTFSTKRAAEAFDAQERSDRLRGTWLDPRGAELTFAEWAATWQASPGGKRANTLAKEEEVLRVHLVPSFGHTRLAAVRPLDVQRFVNDLARRYAPNTVRTYYAVLRAIFNTAVDSDLIGRTPCRGIKLPAAKSKPPRSITIEDIHRLAAAVGLEYRAMIYVAAELGLRFGECAGLQVGDLDFLRRTVTVRRTVGEVSGAVVIGEPKTSAGVRTVAASEPLLAELTASLQRRALTARDPDAWVFEAPEGGPLRYPNFMQRVWSPAVDAVGLAQPRLTFHGLRHAAATSWVAAGVDIRTAQHRLGHSTPRLVLALYAHATTDADRDAADKAGARLFGEGTTKSHEEDESRAPWTRHGKAAGKEWQARARRSTAQTVEPGVGIEPTTSSLQEKCSTD